MPQEALNLYESDESGLGAQPLPGSQVAPHNRIDYITHAGLLKFTNGTGFEGFYERWAIGYRKRLQSLDIGDEWVEMPDFMDLYRDNFVPALIESICGPNLLHLSPDFVRDFSMYDLAMPGLLKGLPRWIIPQAYRARDKLLSSIKKWHDSARAQFDESWIDQDGDTDPYWGSAFIRERQGRYGIFATATNFNRDARAASDLGFIWGLDMHRKSPTGKPLLIIPE